VLAFLSEEWFARFVDLINGSKEYREAAASWEGDIALHIRAEPDKGLPNDVWGYLDLWHGECRAGGVSDVTIGERARYVLSAPYSRWKDVVLGELDPIRAMMQGKLSVRGDLPTIVREVRSASELVHLLGQIDTAFPDGDAGAS
jgi:putative sterol carrier protein